MKTSSALWLLLMALVVAPASVQASEKPVTVTVRMETQDPPVAQAGQSFAWDYADADLSAGAVTRFEIQIDGGTFTSVGMAQTFTDPDTPSGAKSYKTPIPALTTGSHTVAVRACNTELCGDATSPVGFVLAVKPATATGVRIVAGGSE